MTISSPGNNQDPNLILQQVTTSTPIPNPQDRNGPENKQITNIKHGNKTLLEADAVKSSKIKETASSESDNTKKTTSVEKSEKKSQPNKTAGTAEAGAAAQSNATQQTSQISQVQLETKTDAIEKAPSTSTMAIQQLVSTAVKHGFPSASLETPSLTKPKIEPRAVVQEIAAAFANSLNALNNSTIQSLKNFQAIQAQSSIFNLATLQKQNEATNIQRKELQEQKDISNTKSTEHKMNAGEIAAIAIGVTLAVVAVVVAVFTCGAGLALEGAAAAVTASAAVGEGVADAAAGTAAGVAAGAAEGAAEGAAAGVAEGAAEGATEGITEGAAEGATEGITEGAAEGAADIAENASEEGTEIGQASERVAQQAARQATNTASKTTQLIEKGAAETAESTSEASQSVGETASIATTTSSENISSSAEEAATEGIEQSTEDSSSVSQSEVNSQVESNSTKSAIRNGLQKIKEIKNKWSQTYKTGKNFIETKAPNLAKTLDVLGNKWMGMTMSIVLAMPELASGIESIKLSKEQQKLADLQKKEGIVSSEAEQETMFTSFWQQASRIAAGQVGNSSQMTQEATKTFSKLAKAYRSISQGLSNSI